MIEESMALAFALPYVPPKTQKIIIDYLLNTAGLKLPQEALEEYENYYKRVEEKFLRDYMEKR